MKIIRGIYNLRQFPSECVLTIGNFDGVHRGHQELLKQLREVGSICSLPAMVMIFEPQPLELFYGKQAPARITCFREKLHYLEKCDVDYVLCIHFNHRFSKLTAQNFIFDLLVKRLGVRSLIIGEDFRFGSKRQGDFLLLKQAGINYGFNVISTRTIYDGNIRVSSTAVRQALEKNKLEIAKNLLGHPFSIFGKVVHGDKLGRTIGFPTANLLLHRHASPVKGVFVAEVTGLNKNSFPSIANIGIRPTITNVARQQLEVHLLDVVVDLYGRHINVILRKKIRNEQKFSSISELKTQISKDELTTRKFFNLLN